MDKEELKKEGLRSIKEFELAWDEHFKGKPEPKNDKEDRKQQEEFYQWYNYVRKQSDTGKTPAEMYKEMYGKDPPQNFPLTAQNPSRMMNFEWDEDYDEDNFNEDEEKEDERTLKIVSEVADAMFNDSIWVNSKEIIKEMSRKDASKHMFRLGCFMYSKYMNEQMKELSNELKDMSKEEIDKMINKFKGEKISEDE